MRRTLLTLTGALAVLTAAVPAAEAQMRHVIRGAGFGHGIGMSQYGAYGFALEGSGYADILAHYYKGTQLSSAPGAPVRVLLQPVDPYIRVQGVTRANGRVLSYNKTYIARPSGSRILVTRSGGKRVARFAAPLRFKGPDAVRLLGPALNGVGSGLYRGVIEVVHEGGGLTAINELDLDTYVRGVVAGEMPSSWPLEALKAQAVTARTYALATRKTTGLFDQYPDTRSQVYRGVTGESVRSDAAVSETAGRVLTYGGGAPGPHQLSPPRGRPPDRALRAPGRFKRVEVLDRGVSPRVVSARVVGSAGSTVLTGPQIRARLGLRDTWFTFVRASTSVRRARSARPAGWGPRLLEPALEGSWTPSPSRRVLTEPALEGSWTPAPRRRALTVERRGNGRWVKVTKVRTTKQGRYRLDIGRAGVYRVRSGRVAGPSVRVR